MYIRSVLRITSGILCAAMSPFVCLLHIRCDVSSWAPCHQQQQRQPAAMISSDSERTVNFQREDEGAVKWKVEQRNNNISKVHKRVLYYLAIHSWKPKNKVSSIRPLKMHKNWWQCHYLNLIECTSVCQGNCCGCGVVAMRALLILHKWLAARPSKECRTKDVDTDI